MTKKKHEELVNEIAGELNTLFCAGRDGGIPKKLPQVLAENLITLILSAVRDGRLKLPDEVGRWNPYDRKSFGIWLDELPGGETFIALHPLTGTGKEE